MVRRNRPAVPASSHRHERNGAHLPHRALDDRRRRRRGNHSACQRSNHDARQDHSRTREARQARRQVEKHAGRRIRPRGNRACPRGKTRRALGPSGDRDRTFEGPQGRNRYSAQRRVEKESIEHTQARCCHEARCPIGETIGCDEESTAARRPQRCFAKIAVAPGALGGEQAQRRQPFRRGSQSRPHERRARKIRCRSQGGTDKSSSQWLDFGDASARFQPDCERSASAVCAAVAAEICARVDASMTRRP